MKSVWCRDGSCPKLGVACVAFWVGTAISQAQGSRCKDKQANDGQGFQDQWSLHSLGFQRGVVLCWGRSLAGNDARFGTDGIAIISGLSEGSVTARP